MHRLKTGLNIYCLCTFEAPYASRQVVVTACACFLFKNKKCYTFNMRGFQSSLRYRNSTYREIKRPRKKTESCCFPKQRTGAWLAGNDAAGSVVSSLLPCLRICTLIVPWAELGGQESDAGTGDGSQGRGRVSKGNAKRSRFATQVSPTVCISVVAPSRIFACVSHHCNVSGRTSCWTSKNRKALPFISKKSYFCFSPTTNMSRFEEQQDNFWEGLTPSQSSQFLEAFLRTW